ncbi:MAG: glycosyltransferase family 39 protein [Bacteroidales bacterium]|jgi:hypothetical protein
MKLQGTRHFAYLCKQTPAMSKEDYKKRIILLLAVSLLVRGIVAALTELGNDEVYYWTYALFPDWSHFDHPPMVGWIIQLFTLNLRYDSAFALRLPALILGTFNTWMIYRLGILIRNPRTGWYAALLHTGSLYATILAGTFILPDTPLSTFYLLSLFFMLKACGLGSTEKKGPKPVFFLPAGVFAGLAMLSKYTGVFLWAGTFLFVLFYRRSLFKNLYFWLGILASAILFFPVVIWNLTQDYSSFAFHSERISFFGEGIKPFLFGREIMGEFLYNNPVNFIIIIWAILFSFKRKHKQVPTRDAVTTGTRGMILLQSLPLIATFLFFSLFRETLPHWSAPAFYPLILLAAAAADVRSLERPAKASVVFLIVVVLVSIVQIRTGFIPLTLPSSVAEESAHDPYRELGRKDFTLDMYGWIQLGDHFAVVSGQQEALYSQTGGKQGMPRKSAILAHRWFPAAHLDYYVARPAGTVVKTKGPVERTHKYHQITRLRGGIATGEKLYYIESSRFPEQISNTVPLDTFFVHRCGKPVIRYVIHRYTEE